MQRHISILLATLSLAATAAAETPPWVRATPFGSPIVTLAQSPARFWGLYAVARFGRLFASTDGGATWKPRAPSPEPGALIVDAVPDPVDPLTVYARTTSSLLRSTDGGHTWTGIGTDLPSVATLAAEPGHSGHLWAGTSEGLHRSTDGGSSWQAAGLPGLHVTALAIDPREPATWLAAEASGDFIGDPIAIWRSLDRGITWEATPLAAVPSGFNFAAAHFAFDPARPGTAYVFFVGESNLGPVFRTGDRGATWIELPAALGVRDLAPLADGTLVAATDFGVARSSDQGATWVPPLPLTAETATAPKDALTRVLVTAPGALLAAGGSGVWRILDRTGQWASTSRGMVAQGTFSLTAAPVGAPELTTSIEGNGVFRSTDRGATWTRVHAAVEGLQPSLHLTVDPAHPRTIYGTFYDGLADHLLRSTDGGLSWDMLPVPYTCSGGSLCDVTMSLVAVDPHHPETVFVAGSYFFHFGGSGFFFLRSDDGFQTYTRLPAHNWTTLAGDPATPGVFYGLTGKQLLRSTDGGASWHRIGTGLPDGTARSALAIDPRNPRRLWVGTAGRGVFRSTDGGRTFQATGPGLGTGKVVTTLAIDPENPDRVYAGTAARGVYRWEASSRRWTALRRGLPLTGYTGTLAIDPQHPATLYAVHPDQGIYRLDLELEEP